MIVQWCIKGLSLPNDAAAEDIISERAGLLCNWWRDVHRITPPEVRDRLTLQNLNFHVNHFSSINPTTGRPFGELTPFISLSAGVVERDQAAQTNNVHRAQRTALRFGSRFGRDNTAYLVICWLVVGLRESVEIEGVAEEVRDLNTYRRYSAFQTEGEIVAKVIVPDNQIKSCQKWKRDHPKQPFRLSHTYENPRFTQPDRLSNIRGLL